MNSKESKEKVEYLKIKILRRFRYHLNLLKNSDPKNNIMTTSIRGEILELPSEFSNEMIAANKATLNLTKELGIDYNEKNQILSLLPNDSILKVNRDFNSKLEAAMHIYNDFFSSGKVLDENQAYEYGEKIVTVNTLRIKSEELKNEITRAFRNNEINVNNNKLIKKSTLLYEKQNKINSTKRKPPKNIPKIVYDKLFYEIIELRDSQIENSTYSNMTDLVNSLFEKNNINKTTNAVFQYVDRNRVSFPENLQPLSSREILYHMTKDDANLFLKNEKKKKLKKI